MRFVCLFFTHTTRSTIIMRNVCARTTIFLDTPWKQKKKINIFIEENVTAIDNDNLRGRIDTKTIWYNKAVEYGCWMRSPRNEKEFSREKMCENLKKAIVGSEWNTGAKCCCFYRWQKEKDNSNSVCFLCIYYNRVYTRGDGLSFMHGGPRELFPNFITENINNNKNNNRSLVFYTGKVLRSTSGVTLWFFDGPARNESARRRQIASSDDLC